MFNKLILMDLLRQLFLLGLLFYHNLIHHKLQKAGNLIQEYMF